MIAVRITVTVPAGLAGLHDTGLYGDGLWPYIDRKVYGYGDHPYLQFKRGTLFWTALPVGLAGGTVGTLCLEAIVVVFGGECVVLYT